MVDYIWVVSISFSCSFFLGGGGERGGRWGEEGSGKLIFMTRELQCVVN